MASSALAPAFDQWRPAPLNRFPTMYLQGLSSMPDPTALVGRGSATRPSRPHERMQRARLRGRAAESP